ncbi:MAG: rRNA maturation RNase YbeY [bacterium]
MPRIEVFRQEMGGGSDVEWLHRIGETVLLGEGWQGKGSISIVLVDDKEIRELNSRFLHRDRPTDVLAFPLEDGEEDVWGEVYVSEERAKEQALAYGVTFEEELARLVVHGVLHLVGYDDKDKKTQREMREREDVYLNRLIKIGQI